MDLVTQTVLAGAVGEMVLGKKAGNKAIMWGAVGGLIPDLDIFVHHFLAKWMGFLFTVGLVMQLFLRFYWPRC